MCLPLAFCEKFTERGTRPLKRGIIQRLEGRFIDTDPSLLSVATAVADR